MKRLAFWSAMVPITLMTAQPVTAATSELVLKCGNGGTRGYAFVPAPPAAEGSEYTPRMSLHTDSPGWVLAARWVFSGAPAPAEKPPVYLVDGQVVEEHVFEEMPHDDIDSIFIVCSGAPHEQLGIESGRQMVVVFSHAGSLGLLREEMKAIEALQADFERANDRFAGSLEELGWNPGDAAWTVELTTSDDSSSWKAVGRHLLLGDRDAITVSGSR